jgi:hydrogenase maturation factor
LAALLDGLPNVDPQLLVGPSVGEDAAVIDFVPGSERLLVAKSDPITFATDQIGYYAVNVCANDLGVCGATPRFYLPTLLLPAGSSDTALVQSVFAQIGAACRELGIVVAGGHSEVTPAVSQPVVAGTLLGEVRREYVVHSGGAAPGDVVLMAGYAPVEGASIIAREKRSELAAMGWPEAELATAANYLYDPGISILRPALLAADARLVTAMHDPTEGGVATALFELALAANVGLFIDLDTISVPGLAGRLCAAFGLDPLGTIASGALLATAHAEATSDLLAAWHALGWPCAVIGRVLPHEEGLRACRAGRPVPFPRFDVDEIARLWA